MATFVWKKTVFRDLSWVKVKAHFLCFHQQNVLKKWLGSTIMFPFCSGGPIIWMKTLVWFNYLRFHNGMQQFSLPRKANYFSVLKKEKTPKKVARSLFLSLTRRKSHNCRWMQIKVGAALHMHRIFPWNEIIPHHMYPYFFRRASHISNLWWVPNSGSPIVQRLNFPSKLIYCRCC